MWLCSYRWKLHTAITLCQSVCAWQHLSLSLHIAGEDHSAVLAPWPRRTALRHRSAGKQLESCRTRSSYLFLGRPGQHFQVLLERRPRDASIWRRRARRAGALSASHAMWWWLSCSVLLYCVAMRLSVAVHMNIAGNDTSLKWPVMCQVG